MKKISLILLLIITSFVHSQSLSVNRLRIRNAPTGNIANDEILTIKPSGLVRSVPANDLITAPQTLSLAFEEGGRNLTISDGNTVYIPDLNNPFQTLSINGSDITISDGNTITIPSIDSQTLSISGSDLSITGGNTVTLPTGGSSTGLEAIDEGNGIGWRLIGKDATLFGNLGDGAVDLSESTVTGTTFGATGQQSFAQGFNVRATGNRSAVIASGGGFAAGLASAVIGGNNNQALDQYAVIVGGNGNLATANDSGVFSGTNNTVTTDDSVNLGGFGTNVSGNNAASLASFQSTTSGNFSVTLGGRNNDARAFSEVSMGYYPTLPTVADSTEPIGTDRLVNVGNGIFNNGPLIRRDAFTIYHNGATQLHPVSKASITSPKVGMIILDSDEVNKLKFYDGTAWQEITFVAD